MLTFEPCMDARGYPVTTLLPLSSRVVVAAFEELERPMRGGAGWLPSAVTDEVQARLKGLEDGHSCASYHSPSLAGWASPL
jgi:hypothetical protein